MTFLVDVRDADEYAAGHVPGAIHIPLMGIIYGNIGVLADADRQAKIELYCHSGGRAKRAQEVLVGMGFTDVTNLGGLEDVVKK